MRPFVVTVALLLGLVVAVNGAASWDRQRREGRQRAAAARLAPGLAMAFDGQVDERRFQQARLEVIPAPRIVAFGSSRVRDVSGEAFQAAPETFYNLGMSAASVDDYIALWSLLRRRGHVPEVAVFSVDAWVFSRGHDGARWPAVAPDVARFVDGAGGRQGFRWLVDDARYRWDQAKGLLSFTVLHASVLDLERAVHGRRRRGDDLVDALSGGVVAERDVRDRQAIRADGSVMRPAAMRDRAAERVRAEVVRHVSTGPYGLVDFHWDSERAARLALLWRDMASAGVTLVAYMPPYHPAAWAMIRDDARYRMPLEEASRYLAGLSDRVGARFIDGSDPASIPCGEEEFYDMQHAEGGCLARLWSTLLAGRR